MTAYKPGDILLVPFPFTDQTTTKQRPAVVLSSESYNRSHPDLILAPATSKITHKTDEVLVSEWQSADLLKASVVKPILASFETSLVRRQLGALAQSDLTAVRDLFRRILVQD
jgi:mRNA interferase MazF